MAAVAKTDSHWGAARTTLLAVSALGGRATSWGGRTTTASAGPFVAEKEFGPEADWFALGVMLYELAEQRLPFGEHPKYEFQEAEWREPKLADETGRMDEMWEGVRTGMEMRKTKRFADSKIK